MKNRILRGFVACAVAASLASFAPQAAFAADAATDSESATGIESATLLANFDVAQLFIDTCNLDPTTTWYISEGWLDYVVNNNLLKGYSDGDYAGQFRADDPITRGQVATVLYRAAGEPTVSETSTFTDVTDLDEYFYDAVVWAASEGIVTGYLDDDGSSTGIFSPHNYVTRQELATMLGRFAENVYGIEGISDHVSAGFESMPDANTTDTFAWNFMAWCYDEGILTGDTVSGLLSPRGDASRAAMTKMVTVTLRDVVGMPSVGTTQTERETAFLAEVQELVENAFSSSGLTASAYYIEASSGMQHALSIDVTFPFSAEELSEAVGSSSSLLATWNELCDEMQSLSSQLYNESTENDVDLPVLFRALGDSGEILFSARNGVVTVKAV